MGTCSNEYPQSMFWAESWKISEFLSETFKFFVVKFSIYLNSFIMNLSSAELSQREVKVKASLYLQQRFFFFFFFFFFKVFWENKDRYFIYRWFIWNVEHSYVLSRIFSEILFLNVDICCCNWHFKDNIRQNITYHSRWQIFHASSNLVGKRN